MYVQERVSLDENKTISVGFGVHPGPYRLNLDPTDTISKKSTKSGSPGAELASIQPAASTQTEGASAQRGTYCLARSLLGVRKGGAWRATGGG